MNKIITSSIAALALITSAQAATIPFILTGTAGSGLRVGNEPASSGTGSGGVNGPGISFDTLSLALAINVAWGSDFGFTNLTGAVNGQHIHGPTAANNGSGFTQTAGVLFSLTTAINAVTGGNISNTITLTPAQQTDLLNGKYYLNLHTATNGGGEVRGFLVQAAPEPGSAGLLGLGTLLLAARRRRNALA